MTTAATDIVLALVCVWVVLGLTRLRAHDSWKTTLWSSVFILLAVAVRFAFQAVDGDEYLARAFAQLGEELTWAPIRNGIIFGFGGLLLLTLGTALARWSDRRQPL